MGKRRENGMQKKIMKFPDDSSKCNQLRHGHLKNCKNAALLCVLLRLFKEIEFAQMELNFEFICLNVVDLKKRKHGRAHNWMSLNLRTKFIGSVIYDSGGSGTPTIQMGQWNAHIKRMIIWRKKAIDFIWMYK